MIPEALSGPIHDESKVKLKLRHALISVHYVNEECELTDPCWHIGVLVIGHIPPHG